MGGEQLTPEQVINDIRQKKYGIGDDGRQREDFREISGDLRNAIEQLSTGLYEEDVHFILELIQNAEDNRYSESVLPDLKFCLVEEDPTDTPGSKGCLCVYNNETGFSEDNVRSVSATGKSTKTKKQGYIGEKGIGFKSVFTATDQPHIFSNGYQFKFKGEGGDKKIELAYVVPYWVEDVPDLAGKYGYTTCLLLPIKANQREVIKNELSRIDPESILFLSRVENFSVEIEATDTSVNLIRDGSAAPRVDLMVNANGEDQPLSEYWIAKKLFDVPSDIDESKRDQVTDREVSIAFPLSKPSESGTLYAYLPTEVKSGLPFLVNADFLLTANREAIQLNKPWNLWLRDSIADVVLDGLLELAEVAKFKHQVCSFIPIKKKLKSHEEFLAPVCEWLSERLRAEKIVLASSGQMVTPESARICSQEERGLFQASADREDFQYFKLIDSRLSYLRDELQSIGVVELGVRNVKAFFQDEKWLEEQTSGWFVNLYSYLSRSKKFANSSVDGFSLNKLGQGLAKVSDESVYLPTDNHQDMAKIGRLVEAGFPSLSFIDSELLELLSSKTEVRRWCREKLNWLDFSYTGYLTNTLIPYLSAKDELDSDLLLQATKEIVEAWDALDEVDKEVVKTELPLLLDTGGIRYPNKWSEKEIVTPRNFNAQSGWQLVFLVEKENGGFDALSERYMGLVSATELHRLKLFFKEIGVTEYPSSLEAVSTRYDSQPIFEDFYSKAWEGFSRHSTRTPWIKTRLPPISFLEEKNHKNKRYLRAWIGWLEYSIKNPSRSGLVSLCEGKRYWFYRTQYQENIRSALKHYLAEQEWVKSTKGYRQPAQIFYRSHSVEGIFKSALPYLDIEMSPELRQFIGIREEITPEIVVDYLLELSKDEVKDVPVVKKIYRYLSEYGEDLKAIFAIKPLIFSPSAERWFRSNEAVWMDESTLFGDMYGWLSPDYECTGLRDFFCKKLGVLGGVDEQRLSDAWLNLQRSASQDAVEIELKLGKIVPRLLTLTKTLEPLPDWWGNFEKEVKVWTHADQFVSRDAVYYGDNRFLANLFGKDVELAWIPDAGNSVAYYAPLFNALGVQPISLAVTQSSKQPESVEVSSEPSILTSFSKQLLAYLVRHDSEEQFEELLDKGALGVLLRSEEIIVEEVVVSYRIDDWDVEHTVADRNGFCDLDKQALIKRSDSDIDEVKDDVSELIARAVWGTRYRDKEDKVKAILAVRSESRYRKLRDKKDWRMPRELMARVNKHIGESVVVLNQPLTEEVPMEDHGTSDPEVKRDSEESSKSMKSTGQGIEGAPIDVPKRIGTGSQGSDGARRRNVGSRTGASSTSGDGGDRTSKGSTKPSDSRITQTNAGGKRATSSTSRSKAKTKAYNSRYQQRVVTYVYPDSGEEGLESQEDREQRILEQERRNLIGDAAEEFALAYEQKLGWKAKRMPINNPGFDIESVNPETGEARLIEVKGIDGAWGNRGVSISSIQFEKAIKTGAGYWLYVVEHARSNKPILHRINDPAQQIREYRFDEGWRSLDSQSPKEESSASESIAIDLIELTDSDECKETIGFCYDSNLPVPEVGYEFQDENGVVIAEFELAWEDISLAVVLDEIDSSAYEGWTFIGASDVESIKEYLARSYNLKAESSSQPRYDDTWQI